MSLRKATIEEARASYKPLRRRQIARQAAPKKSEPDSPDKRIPAKPAPRVRKRRSLRSKPTEWDRIRAALKPLFEVAGITSCEFRYRGCWKDNALGFAHDAKRRKQPNLRYVALSCNPCHDLLEVMGPEKMKAEVDRVINAREKQS